MLDIELGGVSMRLSTHPRVWSPTSFARSFAAHLAPRIQSGAAVLELGLGGGVLSILAGDRGADVTGLDINADAVRVTTENWAAHGLVVRADRFRQSDRFSSLRDDERFDLVWSNPPVLPSLPDVAATGTRDDFEVAGDEGRLVLDAMLEQSGAYLRDGGEILTIATSLQGWRETEARLQAHWASWDVVEHLELALTDECGPPYLAYWQKRTAQDGQRRVWQREGDATWWHDVWILAAREPR